jgi:hypothetical protein
VLVLVLSACLPTAILAGCGDTAVVVHVSGDLVSPDAPDAIDAFCLAVHDDDPAGGAFGRVYLMSELAEAGAGSLTLTVTPGSASDGTASVRGYRGGIEVARDHRAFAFSSGVDDLSLRLDRCPGGSSGAAEVAGAGPSAAGALPAVSFGRGGSVVVVVGPGFAAAYAVRGGQLVSVDDPLPAAPVDADAIVAFDADGDCDDDIAIAGAGGITLWLRTGTSFVESDGAFAGATPARALAAADVDEDGDIDLVAGGGASLIVYRNDGTSDFDGGTGIAGLTDVTAVAAGNLDGDTHIDLIAGQGDTVGAPARVLFNDASGAGTFILAPAALPEIALRVRDIAAADANADGFDDVLLAVEGGPVRAYVNRGDGRLEDRSFVLLPSQPDDALGLAAADWDADCLVDVVIGFAAAPAIAWSGSETGAFDDDTVPDTTAPSVELADVDDDGDRDLILVSGEEVTWVDR